MKEEGKIEKVTRPAVTGRRHLWLEPPVLCHWATRPDNHQPSQFWVQLLLTTGLFTFLYFRLITSTFPVWGKMLWALIGSHFVFHTYYILTTCYFIASANGFDIIIYLPKAFEFIHLSPCLIQGSIFAYIFHDLDLWKSLNVVLRKVCTNN